MPADLCYDTSKVSQQGHLNEETLPSLDNSGMISAEMKTADFTLLQNTGLMQPDGDYAENVQCGGELTEEEGLDYFKSSSLSEYDLERSESLSVSFDSAEDNKYSDYFVEAEIIEQSAVEEQEAEPLTLFQVMPDLCEYNEHENPEISELVLSDFEAPYDADFEPSEEDSSSSDEICVSNFYERLSGPDRDLDLEPYSSTERGELNNQNMLSECHATHFESSEMCQTSNESEPAGPCGSLEQQAPAENKEKTVDSNVTSENDPDSLTGLFESSEQSQLSDDLADDTSERTSEYYQQEDYRDLSENEMEYAETVEQCSRCGKYFEDSERSEPDEQCLELCEALATQCSVFHSSDLPKEKPPVDDVNEVKMQPECDMMFVGSMETFEARWLSQFLAVDCHQNGTFVNQEDLSVAISQPSDELLPSDDSDDAEPVIEALDAVSRKRTLCEECEKQENERFVYSVSWARFETCHDEAGAFEFGSDDCEDREPADEACYLDECSEEEYADCIDSKSQGSNETDESFKSCIDEPEEIYPDQSEGRPFEDLTEEHVRIYPSQESSENWPNRCGDSDECVCDGINTSEESCCEKRNRGQEMYESYAEALCSGHSGGMVQSHKPCPECAGESDEVVYELCDEDESSALHAVEIQCTELLTSKDVVNTHGESAAVLFELKSEIAGHASEAEDVSETLSESAVTCHEQKISAVEVVQFSDTVSHDFAQDEVGLDLAQMRLDENGNKNEDKAHHCTLPGDGQAVENSEISEGVNKEEWGHSPYCGEIEASEDEQTMANAEHHNVLNHADEAQNGTLDLLIKPSAIDKDTEPPEPCDVSEDQTETSAPQGDPPAQSECGDALEGLIHQVTRSETDQGEQDDFFKLADEQPEEIEVSEDTEASDDEDYPESCDCEFCVLPIDQVQCSRVGRAALNEALLDCSWSF